MDTQTRQLCQQLQIEPRTISRWRAWWLGLFPLTPLWRAACALFMPPVVIAKLPTSLITSFAGFVDVAQKPLLRLLVFLRPLSVRYLPSA